MSVIAVFVDIENVQSFSVKALMEILLTHGNVVIRRVYGNILSMNQGMHEMLHEEGFDYCHVPSGASGKNASDIRLALEALDCANMDRTINLVVLVTGDSDFIPLVHKLRERNIKVWGFSSTPNNTSSLFVKQVDSFRTIPPLAAKNRRPPHHSIDDKLSSEVLSDILAELLKDNTKVQLSQVHSAIIRRFPGWIRGDRRFKTVLKSLLRSDSKYTIDGEYIQESA